MVHPVSKANNKFFDKTLDNVQLEWCDLFLSRASVVMRIKCDRRLPHAVKVPETLFLLALKANDIMWPSKTVVQTLGLST